MVRNLVYCFFFILVAMPGTSSSLEALTDEPPVRLAVVITPHSSGLMDALLADFTSATGTRVNVYSGTDVYDQARKGKADLIISHFGKPALAQFVMEGYGRWPKIVFSNQAVLIGPKTDPAHIRGMDNAAAAFKQIATAKAPFILNSGPTTRYLTSILWAAAGEPTRGNWFVDKKVKKGKAIRLAEQRQAYVVWGAYPFLKYKAGHKTDLEILVSDDPLFQRIMACVVVNPKKIKKTNVQGALALERYLVSPRAQSKIAAFRSQDSPLQLWWPAGRHN